MMNTKVIAGITSFLLVMSSAQAAITRVNEAAFTADAGLITFSEFPISTINPTYAPTDYGGDPTAPTVTFGGFFNGQSLGSAATCPAGAAVSGCVIGSPNAALSLAVGSPDTFIASDSSNPTSPVLSGTPLFNGPVSVLFSNDLAGVGLDGGFFNAIGGTAITAFARDGSVLGSVLNEGLGIEFLGLVTADGLNTIAGLQFSLVGAEPAGFAIDNLRFGVAGDVVVSPPAVPEPDTYAMVLAGFGLVAWAARRKIGRRTA